MHADVGGDVGNVIGRQAFDRRHVAELPVMGANALRHRHLKGGIAVMRRFVDLVQQRGGGVGAIEATAVAGRAVRLVQRLAYIWVGHQAGAGLRRRLPALCGDARRGQTQQHGDTPAGRARCGPPGLQLE
ncbi:hypothetical protein RZS08_16660, partial [Arthrospira platensis SPKY1]|nr:hypothetical protein [Arthrospira platensis SPKY1]